MLRTTVAFAALLIGWVSDLSAQNVRQILEEIKSAPKSNIGVWQIGNRKFKTDEDTKFGFDGAAPIGWLAIVTFVEGDKFNLATAIQPLRVKAVDISDGPYVFWKNKTAVEILTIDKGKVGRKFVENIRQPILVENLPGPVSSIRLDPTPPKTPVDEWNAPPKLLAISDLEGNYLTARRFLETHRVIDKNGAWNWDTGHLVLVGDIVDRGPRVTELMWMLKRLEHEAAAAGGAVHYVLGNHEAMVMAGDLRYIHLKYHFVSQRLGIRYDKLFGSNTEMGRWWRSKNAVERIGDLLFVHGGYSPVLDDAQLPMTTLNKRIRAGLAPNSPEGLTAAENPVQHQHGPFWYRGYFPQYAASWGGLATQQEVAKILTRHRAKHVVIGHTVVPQVGPVDRAGQIIGIDVKWADPERSEGLLEQDGQLWRVLGNGKREELKLKGRRAT